MVRDYEVIIWDYDPAPDANCYVRHRWLKGQSLRNARAEAWRAVNDNCFVGAAVYKDGELVEGHGLILGYPCGHTRVRVIGSDETGLQSIQCEDCGEKMTRRFSKEDGEYVYLTLEDLRREQNAVEGRNPPVRGY